MKREQLLTRIRAAFLEDSKFKIFLLSLLITGLSYGLYKGMLDNFLAEIVGMGEMDRGVTEFFREIPGVLLVFVLAAFYMLSAEALYKIGAVIMLVGMGMHALLPPTKVLAVLAICVYSFGEHIQLGMKNTLSLNYAKPGCGGAALGAQNAVYQIGTLAGYLLIVAVFSLFVGREPYTAFFMLAAVLAGISMVCSFGLSSRSEMDATKRRFYFHRKYYKYYMLEMFYGARKQVFFTFGPYVLILFYGANAAMASNLYVQDLSDSADEMKAAISTGVSINHLITIFIALFGGWIWQTLGIELLFILSAVLGLCNSAYAATIKTGKKAVS